MLESQCTALLATRTDPPYHIDCVDGANVAFACTFVVRSIGVVVGEFGFVGGSSGTIIVVGCRVGGIGVIVISVLKKASEATTKGADEAPRPVGRSIRR